MANRSRSCTPTLLSRLATISAISLPNSPNPLRRENTLLSMLRFSKINEIGIVHLHSYTGQEEIYARPLYKSPHRYHHYGQP